MPVADPNGPRAPLRVQFWRRRWMGFHRVSSCSSLFSAGESGQTGELHRMEPVALRPIIKCRQTGCAGSCPPSVVGYGYQAGKETATCRICGTNFPRYNVILSDLVPEIGEVTVVIMLFQPRPDVPAGFLGVNCRVNSRPMRRIPMPLRAPVRPASRNFQPCLLACVVPSSFQGARALSDMHDCVPVSSVGRNKSSFRCVRTPCCFLWFWWS